MNQDVIVCFFALLRIAIGSGRFAENKIETLSQEEMSEIAALAAKHDIAHLIALGMKKNGFLSKENNAEKSIFKAICRYEQLNFDGEEACKALENAEIPFIPLKGFVIRDFYPEPWMRTSCDIDVLVKKEDLKKAVACLSENLGYIETVRSTHEIVLETPAGNHIEIHFDLVEEGRANDAIKILKNVWENSAPKYGCNYQYEMSDSFFYFYHVAHMAKHFEVGGCGIRPFIDMWLLDGLECADVAGRDVLLEKGDLLRFANAMRGLSKVWLEGKEATETEKKLESFLLRGGAYGTTDNKVALGQSKRGGKVGYLVSRVFVPNSKLKRYYPILEKYPWLMPVMQVRRWFMMFNPSVAKMAKSEMSATGTVDKKKSDKMTEFLNEIGL